MSDDAVQTVVGAQMPDTFESARDELEGIVRRLEEGNIPLQESLDLWERGEALAAYCDRLLGQAEARIEAAKAHQDDSP
jgi:exodeoxyribonuclease VII small subunit